MPPRASPTVLAEGSIFGAYEVRRRIAVGGMGEIYLCRHRLLDRLDAVKVLRPHLASNVDFRRRFLREALSAARLRHPHVVTIYTADEAEGLLFLAMEYVAADDLAALLHREMALAPQRVVRLLRGVADALDAAHRAQLVHRDIKPSNLLVTEVGTPDESCTLVDFGISRILDSDNDITRAGEIVGTLAYCAPEQLDRGGIDGAVDQYALACVVYECLTGQVPYPRYGQLAVMTAHLTAPPPKVSAFRPELGAVDDVLARALAKNPRERYPSCGEFLSALSTVLDPAPTGGRAAAAPAAVPVGLAGVGATYPDPAALSELALAGEDLRWPAEAELAVRVGRWAGGALVVSLADGPYAIRGSARDRAGLARWLVAQAVVRHRDRDLCLVAAIAADVDDNWLWLNWLPQARPSNPPVVGPHVATSAEAAGDLIARLRTLLSARRVDQIRVPRVLAVLDRRLGGSPDDPGLVDAQRFGIHIVYLVDPGDPVPAEMSTLDLTDGRCRWWRPGNIPVDGSADVVEAGYVRELADTLGD